MITDRIERIKATLPAHVTLVAVSKFHPAEAILEAYQTGQRVFGESRVQELVEKQAQLPQDIEWHMIGHLQTNKVKYILPFISLIQSVDSLKLLNEIERQAQKLDLKVKVLLQVHIAQEAHKFGFTGEEVSSILSRQTNWPHLEIQGLMAMATFSDDETQILQEFDLFHNLYVQLMEKYDLVETTFNTCCFGMSDDYPLALKKGSNMVRIGSAIFGSRS